MDTTENPTVDDDDNNNTPTKMVKLQSSDGKIFEVELAVAKMSLTVQNLLDDMGIKTGEGEEGSDDTDIDDDDDDEDDDEEDNGDGGEGDIKIDDNIIPLKDANSGTLRKIIGWCVHHKDDPPPPEEEEKELEEEEADNNDGDDENAEGEEEEEEEEEISEWDAEFLKVSPGELFELILAASSLDIKALRDLCCKATAKLIRGKSVEQIRETFGIKNDFTDEEFAQYYKENEWCEEK